MDKEIKVRQSHFPLRILGITFGIMLLMSGVHMGLIQLLNVLHVNGWAQAPIIMVYWLIIAAGFTVVTRIQIEKTYEIPMQELAKATSAVAHGDFSVYVPTLNSMDKLDYLDVMIMDFNKMVEELGSIETLKTDFFSNVSHEIKTPISVISNHAQILKMSGDLTSEQMASVDGILTASKKLSNLITNMLKLNRLEKQNISPEAEEYDLCEQLCDCILQFENRWEEKQIELEVDMEDRVRVKADASLLELVWNNLLSNAVKFTEAGGTVKVKEESTKDSIRVQVTDSGCGMDKETMNHMFDKFYQGDTSHATEGNGLGMALTLRVLQISGGDIAVDSEVGVGTTFTVTLPKIDLDQESIEME
ncbi:MAG: HAMP domain-containing sensor histidine kinase [Lachnospiraceae bacterium]|nr:HAMP domain-containing sensor histidine kinase [Lachnospiraceae bacterium]